MNDNMRKALYALVPVVIAMLTAYGLVTEQLGVLWANVAVLVIGFAYAASKATGDRFLDPELRRALYVMVPGVVALIGGYFSIDVGLWTSLVVAILGAIMATKNVPEPGETVVVLPPQDELPIDEGEH